MPTDALLPDLPIAAVLPALRQALAGRTTAVLQAPPGAGKTTQVPLALLAESWLGGRRIVVLEPRRLAARAAAQRMAYLLGEDVGGTVGYRTRLDSRVGPATRIEVVTEGILTRRLQTDSELADVGAIIFDEFHERSLQGDLGLALTLDVQRALREDLRLLVMSATLDGTAVARLLDGAPVVRSEGRSYPVATRYLSSAPGLRVEPRMAEAIRGVLREEAGDVLAFLPGEGEIRRTLVLLEEAGGTAGVAVVPLYGALSREQQDAAIRPSPPGNRKVVLATSIAETSLTIEGVRVVVDGGLSRQPRFDPRSGMSGLETVRVSRAAAEQRRGRAGRLGPGLCIRLWAEAEDRGLRPFDAPEILNADLAPLALELAAWGVREPEALSWLDPPPRAALDQGRELLGQLGALAPDGQITAHGRTMAGLGLHPRLAHMLVRGRELGHAALACDLAALLAERDIARPTGRDRDTDLRWRLEALRGDHAGMVAQYRIDRSAQQVVRRASDDFRRRLRIERAGNDVGATGLLVALAYPDRVAQRRGAGFRLRNGRGAVFPERDPLGREALVAIASLDSGNQDARAYLAAPLHETDLEQAFGPAIEIHAIVEWNDREQAVVARRQRRLGALVLHDQAFTDAPAEAVVAALLEGVRRSGLAALPWGKDLIEWRARVGFLRVNDPAGDWPDLSDATLLASLDTWLGPFVSGIRRLADIDPARLGDALGAQLDWSQRQRLDRDAPTHLDVPSGSQIRLDYTSGAMPVLAVRLQELFGATTTPTILQGRVPVVLHLLSPARRPVQVTRDLASFWRNGYPQVRGDLRGRYPRHAWPDDPSSAPPTARAKPRRR